MTYLVRKKRQRRRQWEIGTSLFFLLFLVALLGKMNWQAWQKGRESTKRLKNLETQVQVLEKQKQNLQEKIQEVNRPDYLEKVGREELNLQKPGEKAIAFIAPPKKSLPASSLRMPWWKKVLGRLQKFFKR